MNLNMDLSFIQDCPKDAEFQNVHLVNYPQMQAIFASGVATGRYAMGSNEPLVSHHHRRRLLMWMVKLL